MSKPLPKSLTSYDLLKTLAIILTVIDHVGHFFFPEEMWFRVLGRLCVPIWFFLIGYANTTKVPNSFWIGGTLLVMSSIISGQYLLPLNILFTMALLRMYRAGVVRHSMWSPEAMRGMFLILFVLSFPTAILVEYGSMAMLFVLIGYMARRREEIFESIEKKHVLTFMFAAFTAFYITMGMAMPTLTEIQALAMLVGLVAVSVILWRFKPIEFTGADKVMAPSFIKMFQFFGRKTLEIYVAHLIIFRGAALYLYPDKYTLLDWSIVPPSLVAMFSTGHAGF